MKTSTDLTGHRTLYRGLKIPRSLLRGERFRIGIRCGVVDTPPSEREGTACCGVLHFLWPKIAEGLCE